MWRYFVHDVSTLLTVDLYRQIDAHSRGEWVLPTKNTELSEAMSELSKALSDVGSARGSEG